MYLASPYTHKDPVVVDFRVKQTMEACASLHAQNIVVYSPIVHWHFVARACGLPTDFAPWLVQNHGMIDLLGKVGILRIDGWRESNGVRDEIGYALKKHVPIEAYDLVGTMCISQGLIDVSELSELA